MIKGSGKKGLVDTQLGVHSLGGRVWDPWVRSGKPILFDQIEIIPKNLDEAVCNYFLDTAPHDKSDT